jgi:hypothetical protein
MLRRVVLVVLVSLVTLGCSPDDDPVTQPTSAAPSEASSGSEGSELAAAWSTDLGVTPFATSSLDDTPSPNEGGNLVDGGDRTIALGEDVAVGLDTATGAIDWTVSLPAPVCASAPEVNSAGTAVVLVGSNGDCTDVVALDSADGHTLWTTAVPRAAAAYGHEVSIGNDSVVVTGECAGFTVFAADDGSILSDRAGEKVGPKCASATSDGASVVLSSGSRLSVFDAADGRRTSEAEVAELGRVGDVVSSEPLVVSAAVGSRGRLVALGGSAPLTFGRESSDAGGVPAASVVAAGILWVQYDGVPELVGYDPATGVETATIPIDAEADSLVGAHDDRLVVTAAARVDGSSRSELRLYDPTRPTEPRVVGLLPPPAKNDESVSSSAVVGDVLVRMWRGDVDGGRAEGVQLLSDGRSGGDGSQTPASGDPDQVT